MTKFSYKIFVLLFFFPLIHLAQQINHFSTPVNFVKNEGQWDNEILFQTSSPGWGSNVYLMKNGVSFGFYKTEAKDESKNAPNHNHTEDPSQTMVWNMEFVGANTNASTEGFEKQKSYSNYLKGNDFSKHKSFVPHYKGAQYNQIYQGVDVKYYQGQQCLEYDWIIKPNGNINNIKLKCNGVKSITINNSQQLVITTAWGDLIETLPESYQIINGQKQLVNVQYKLYRDNTFGYEIIGEYNNNYTLIIDPITLKWATYMGTGIYSYGHDTKFDQQGNLYVAGCSKGSFPTSAGVFSSSNSGGETDIVIAKFNSSTGALLFSTFIGTDSMDHGGRDGGILTATSTGEIIYGGSTFSANFPLTANAIDNFFAAPGPPTKQQEGVLFKLSSNGSTLVFSTFYGGTANDFISSITEDLSGNIYFAGRTESSDILTTAGTYDPIYNAGNDCFFGKINSSYGLDFCSLLGTGGSNYINRIKRDNLGNIYIAGLTFSTTYPTTTGVVEPTYSGTMGFTAFLSKFNPTGSTLLLSTYIATNLPPEPPFGIGGHFRLSDIAITNNYDVYLAGEASNGFPTSTGAYQTTGIISNNGIVVKINNTFSSYLNSTYYTGTGGGSIYPSTIYLDKTENVYIGGNTIGTSNLPITACAPQSTEGFGDFFLARFNPTLTTLDFATFIGGINGGDLHCTMDILDICGNPKVGFSGFSVSNDFPTNGSSFQPSKLASGGCMSVAVLEVSRPTADFTFSANNCAVNFTDASTGTCIWKQNWTPDEWAWDFGDGQTSTLQNPTHTYASNGTYNVKLIVNCPADTVEKTVTISSCSVTCTASAGASTITNPLCNGGTGIATVNLSNGSGGTYTYSWSNGASTITTATSNQQQLTSNNYTVTITDGACSTTSTIQITEPSVITPGNITPTAASCGQSNGSALTAVATGGTGAFTYTWSNGNSGLTANNLSAQTYTLTVNDNNNCSATNTITINNTGGASISSISKTDVLCNGGTGSSTVNISGGASGNYTYSWSNGASTVTSATSNQELLPSNTYKVTVTDGACITSTTITITQPNAITLSNPIVTSASCNQNNGSISITTSGGTGLYTYSWSNGVNTITSSTTQQLNNLTTNTYTLTVTDGNNCTQTTSVNISNAPAPIINSISIPTLICNGNKGTVAVTASGTGVLTYKWSSTAATNTTGIFNGITAGNYTLTVSDGNGCLQISTVLITQPNAISVTTPVATNTNCNQSTGSITFATPTGGTGNYTYNWSNGATTQNISLLAATGYTVTVQDKNGCSITTSAIVNNNNGTSILSATATNPLCNGNTGSATVTITPSTAPYTYSWSNGVSTVTTATSNQELLTSNSYTLTITDANNCSATANISITEPAAIVIASPITTAANCGQSDGTAQLSLSGGTGLYTYSWSNSITGITSNTQLNNTTLMAGIFTLQVSDANGCNTSFSSGIANNNTPPVAAASATSYSITEGETTILSAGGGISYTWTPTNTLTCNSCPITIANPTTTTTYTLIVKDNVGCSDTTNITINVKKPCAGEEDVFIANVFSPNNDGKNDVLLIQGNGLTNIYFTIYDRWGNNIFETRDQAQGWDGSVNGNTANAGAYVYFLKGTCKKTNTEVILKGNVSVLK